MAAAEIVNALTGKKKIKSVAADVGKKTLRKQLGAGKTRKRRIIRRSPPKISRRRRKRKDIFANLERILDQQTILIFDMDTLPNSSWRFLTKFLLWNQLSLLMFKKFILVLHWIKAALKLNLKQIEVSFLI